MEKHNLKPKCITDFDTNDTIYIQVNESGQHTITFLCQFIEIKGQKIYGRMISVDINPKLYQQKINEGLIVSARLSKCALYGENPVRKKTYYHWFKNSGYAIYPKEYDLKGDNSDIIKEHPSFGMINLSRRSASVGQVLFGSSIQHKETLTISISNGRVNRDLNREWFGEGKELIEIELSSAQFSEFITSPNRSGIPCTIKHIDRTFVPSPPYENRKDMFSKEFKNTIENMSVNLTENSKILENILSKKAIGKGDKQEIAALFNEILRTMKSTIPFIETSFVEQMDRTVTEAKSEIESFVARRISEAGIKALLGEGNNAGILLEPKNEKNDED